MGLEDEILDYKKKTKPWYRLYGYYAVALGLFIYWFVAQIMIWPYAYLALILGLAFLAWAAVKRFLAEPKKKFYTYAYLGGRLTLITGIYFYLQNLGFATELLWTSFSLFAIGVTSLALRRNS